MCFLSPPPGPQNSDVLINMHDSVPLVCIIDFVAKSVRDGMCKFVTAIVSVKFVSLLPINANAKSICTVSRPWTTRIDLPLLLLRSFLNSG